MELLLYERPRERLREKGARSLSISELLQVIIGSGTAALPVGKVARSIANCLERSYKQSSEPTYSELIAVTGIGDAKACQLLASIELGRRVGAGLVVKSTPNYGQLITPLASARKPSIMCISLDGTGAVIQSQTVKRAASEHYSLTAKRMVSAALSDGAVAIVLGVGCASQSPNVTMGDLSLTKGLTDSLKAVGVRLAYAGIVHKAGVQEIALAVSHGNGKVRSSG